MFTTMRKLLPLLGVLVALLLMGCSKDKTDSEATVIGSWVMKAYSAGWSGTVEVDSGEALLVFASDGMVTVNKSTYVELPTILPEGVYHFSVDTDHRLTIDGVAFEYYFMDSGTLVISQNIATDGSYFMFHKK